MLYSRTHSEVHSSDSQVDSSSSSAPLSQAAKEEAVLQEQALCFSQAVARASKTVPAQSQLYSFDTRLCSVLILISHA